MKDELGVYRGKRTRHIVAFPEETKKSCKVLRNKDAGLCNVNWEVCGRKTFLVLVFTGKAS